MILERHYDDEALLAIMSCGKEAVERDAHLSGCVICMDNLESYQTMAEVLGEKSVWDFSDDFEEGTAKGAAAVRQFVEKMDSEDVTAERLVEELLQSPRQWWMTTIEADERYHTAGVLRRLIEVSEANIRTSPGAAVEYAAAATALRHALGKSTSVLQLFGAAYRQHAFALFYVGDFARALESVEEAQAIFEACAVNEYALARLKIVRSLIYSRQDRYAEALELSREAAQVFEVFGDAQRYTSARLSEVYLLMQESNDRDALAILLDIQNRFWTAIDLDTRARVLTNVGSCRRNLGQIPEALEAFQVSADLYAELRNEPEGVRLRYNVALLLAAEGQPAIAKERFRSVIPEFLRLGMTQTAVVAGLDLAEILLLENNFEEVEQLCRAAIRQFEAAGVPYSREALTALTFLREAAEQRRATQATVWHVKTYIRRLPDQPALLFAPAPLPPA